MKALMLLGVFGLLYIHRLKCFAEILRTDAPTHPEFECSDTIRGEVILVFCGMES